MSFVDRTKIRVKCPTCGRKFWFEFDTLCTIDALNTLLLDKGWGIGSKSGRIEYCPACPPENKTK